MTEAVRYALEDGIVNLILDDPDQSANTMNHNYADSMEAAVDRLVKDIANEPESIKGAVISSTKKTFFAGGDLKQMIRSTPADAQRLFDELERIKDTLRKLETSGRPVVAAINGAALGGGLEIALAAHRRIAVDGGYTVGLPEVTLGLLPGGGGVTRVVRMFGLADALTKFLLQGQQLTPAKALAAGLVDEVVATRDELVSAAKAWIEAQVGNDEAATQPWDRKGYKMPGGTPKSPALAGFLPAFPALLRKQLKGADYPAPRAIMSAAVEGAQLDVAGAERIEARYFVELATGGHLWLWGAAILFVLARILHAFGMDRPGANWLRVGGIAISWTVLLGLGAYAIVVAYQSPPIRGGFQLSPGRTASSSEPAELVSSRVSVPRSARVSASVSPGTAIMSRPTEQTAVIASSLARVRSPRST